MIVQVQIAHGITKDEPARQGLREALDLAARRAQQIDILPAKHLRSLGIRQRQCGGG